MITVRPSQERGHASRGWLESYHTFSFAEYYDPAHMSFRSLRVINDDVIAGGGGFGLHPHRDMEIITYVTQGALEHRDSLGTGSVLQPGDVQRMSAGTGIRHSEFNHSQTDPLSLLQIWIEPERAGLPPSYEENTIPDEEKRGRLRLVASRDGRDGSLTIHQDAALYATLLEPGQAVQHILQPGRHAWVQVIRGVVTLNGQKLAAGDGAAVSNETELQLAASEAAELLLFDLA